MAWRSNRHERGNRASADARTSAGPRTSTAAAGDAAAPTAASTSAGPAAGAARSMRRHDRRPIRSSVTGPLLPNPDGRLTRFELAARAAVQLLRAHLPEELRGVHIVFASAPPHDRRTPESARPMLYSVDRGRRTIMLYRIPIQRSGGLHVDDEEHRALFIGHCVYLAVCELLDANPWDLLPGHFEHF